MKKNKSLPDRPIVYLVWALSNQSSNQLANLSLRAVYTENNHSMAKTVLKQIKLEQNTIRGWIERRECNHHYGQQMICPSTSDERFTKGKPTI